MVVFPFAFHIPVQQQFKPLWSRLLLYELEPSVLQAATDDAASGISFGVSLRLTPTFELASKGGLASRYATGVIALRGYWPTQTPSPR